MSASEKEPWNPFYTLLLIFSCLLALTALAIAVVPVLEEKATQAGQPPPPSAFRDALRRDGWRWLVWEVAGICVFGLASMALDRWRRWKKTMKEERGTRKDATPGKGSERETAER